LRSGWWQVRPSGEQWGQRHLSNHLHRTVGEVFARDHLSPHRGGHPAGSSARITDAVGRCPRTGQGGQVSG
jgi:hypothetical protein